LETPQNTTILFQILDSNDNIIQNISTNQLRNGYSLSNLVEIEIKVKIIFSTINSSQTPILYEWAIFGLEGKRDTGNYWENIPYYYWYGGAVVLIVIFLSCCCFKRIQKKKSGY
jgi:hypothetical protein